MKIYYAHHQWKYNTKIENYEINLIKTTYPNSLVVNPNGTVDQLCGEEEIMRHCLDLVSQSDMVIFSSISGVVGRGVYTEVTLAIKNNIPVGYIHDNKISTISPQFELTNQSDRLYAVVKTREKQ